ncbi:hypothetical protein Tco_1503662 [Tanacetum coccineum]
MSSWDTTSRGSNITFPKLNVGPSKSALLSFDFLICLQYHLMKDPISPIFQINLFSSRSVYALAIALPVVSVQKSSKLRTSKLEAVLKQMHQNRTFSSCFGLSLLEELEEDLGRHGLSYKTWPLNQ